VAGYSVKEVAARIGYRQPSSFVETFRRTFSSTPEAWMRTWREGINSAAHACCNSAGQADRHLRDSLQSIGVGERSGSRSHGPQAIGIAQQAGQLAG
jgi:hypothetical protein